MALLRVAYRIAYRLLLAWAVVARPHARGVKCVLVDGAGRALFVRHHYGGRAQWELPGGGAHRGEPLADAAAREAWEELGADVPAWEQAGVASMRWYGREEDITVFTAPWPGGPVRPDPVEIAAIGWYPLDAPPAPVGPTTAASLAVMRRS